MGLLTEVIYCTCILIAWALEKVCFLKVDLLTGVNCNREALLARGDKKFITRCGGVSGNTNRSQKRIVLHLLENVVQESFKRREAPAQREPSHFKVQVGNFEAAGLGLKNKKLLWESQ